MSSSMRKPLPRGSIRGSRFSRLATVDSGPLTEADGSIDSRFPWTEKTARWIASGRMLTRISSANDDEDDLVMCFKGSIPMYGRHTSVNEHWRKQFAAKAGGTGDKDQDILFSALPLDLTESIRKTHEDVQLDSGIFTWTVNADCVTISLKPELKIIDIVLDKGRSGVLRYEYGKQVMVPVSIEMPALLQALHNAVNHDWVQTSEITKSNRETAWADPSASSPAWLDVESKFGPEEPVTSSQRHNMTSGDEPSTISYTEEALDKCFTVDNRLGIPGTLHRISCIRNRQKNIIGLTCRIGRHKLGDAKLLLDILFKVAKKTTSVLLLGPPGVGKTTLLRDCVRILADEFKLQSQVMVVDTSCEIAGGGDLPHKAIGDARRIQVRDRTRQHDELLEAVQNHTPKVIAVDEISTLSEAKAVANISQRGVNVIATAHGNTLKDLLGNAELRNLLGGFQTVILSDVVLKERYGGDRTKKNQTERKGAPAFQIIVEVQGFADYNIHMDAGKSVDRLLNHKTPSSQRRWSDGQLIHAKFLGEDEDASYDDEDD